MSNKRLPISKQGFAPLKLYKQPGAILLTSALILAGAILAVMFLLPKGERINGGGYQVVYTATGQAYFGKLQNTGGDYVVMKQPFTAQDVAKPSQDKEQAEATAENQTTLLKVRDQVYGPEDVISIRAEQVLFWQNLRSDSKIVKAIESKQ